MRVLVLHSDVAVDAPPDEQDTLVQAEAVEAALTSKGHEAARAPFRPDRAALAALIAREHPAAIFNLVESVWGRGALAPIAPMMLAEFGVPFTGSHGAAMAAGGNKLLVKGLMAAGGLPTPDWAVPPHWDGLRDGPRWIVKAVDEDASIGLDDGAVVQGRAAVLARAQASAARHGGRWFAEAYIEGREFNVAVIEQDGAAHVLPIAEMRFDNWGEGRPHILGYAAKWDEASPDFTRSVRVFGGETREAALHGALSRLAVKTFGLFGLSGYARIDFRVDAAGHPFILEVNPNPCLEPQAGFAAAAAQAGLNYADLIDRILRAIRL